MASIRATEVTEFFSELAVLLENNISLDEALNTIQQYQTNAAFSELVIDIKQETAKTSLADGLAKYPKYFESFIINLIRSHQSTSLVAIIRKIADYRDEMETGIYDLNSKLFATVSYFLFVIVIFSILMTATLIYIAPVFKEMYGNFGSELPVITQQLFLISDTFIAYEWFIVAGILILAILLGRQRLLPSLLFGHLYQKLALIRFLHTYRFMLSNGASTKEAIAATIEVTQHSAYSKSLHKIHEQLTSTASLSKVLTTQRNAFPQKVIHTIVLGEKANQLDQLLVKLAEVYTKQFNQAIEPTAKIVSVMLVIVLGIIIGLFVIAMYSPVFSIGSIL